MWDQLGFRESPYNTNPLKARAEDISLLVGRSGEATEFFTSLEVSHQGILVLSGSPGVGKTSFLNIQQYRLENDLAPFGPKLLAARDLCPVQPTDSLEAVARRALSSLCKSVEKWCVLNGSEIPPQSKRIGKWISGTISGGIEVGLSIAGFGGNFGRTVELPSFGEATLEMIGEAVNVISQEINTELKFTSCIIALDNLENLEEEQLGRMLISFRDTLFSIERIWWILIGQSGLGSLIQSLDPRVFERITGSGIEIKPIELDEFDEAIAIRVSEFHSSGQGKAPLTRQIHQHLFEASRGEMRFVFKYSESICAKFIENMRSIVLEDSGFSNQQWTRKTSKDSFGLAINNAIARTMIGSQIPDSLARDFLKEIVQRELTGLFLKPKERSVLLEIGQAGKARASDFRRYSLKTMQDFSSNYLTKMYNQKLLLREQEGRAVNYRLRGIAQLSYAYGLLG
jgi:Cdc6-like AAA superfamily ATPase